MGVWSGGGFEGDLVALYFELADVGAARTAGPRWPGPSNLGSNAHGPAVGRRELVGRPSVVRAGGAPGNGRPVTER